MQEITAVTIVISVVLICVTSLGVHGCQQTENTKKEAIKVGLVEELIGGNRIWTKPRYER